MSQNHLIGTVSLDFRASRQTDGVALQEEVSDWFWQDVLPELSKALDEVIPPDVVVRLDRVTIELPAVGRVNWKEKLTQSVCRMVAEEIVRLRLFPRPTDAPVDEVSPVTNGFDAWLDFIRSGHQRLSVADPADWQTATLDRVATSPAAVSALRHLLRSQPVAIERLSRQYDPAFLGQLAEAITGHSASELLRWQAAFRSLWATAWWPKSIQTTSVSPEQVELVFWMMVFEKLSADANPSAYSQWINSPVFFHSFLERVTGRSYGTTTLALAIARFFQEENRQLIFRKIRNQKPQRRQSEVPVFDETQLRKAILEALQPIPEGALLVGVFGRILLEQDSTIKAFLKNRHPATLPSTENEPDNLKTGTLPNERFRKGADDGAVEGKVFYVKNAGIVLLHPFLSAFLGEIGLQPDQQADRQRAVQLVHYLATGETQTPEYELVLPKLLVGCPIHQPIDRAVRLTKTEKAEAKGLLEMVIGYWTALGSTSVAGLREGFLRRDGRLSKRDNGWLLQIESQTIDILLNQLPWGIGVIKHDWMADFLYVEWY